MQRTMLFFLLIILFLGGIVWLQIKLSNSVSRWPGLILPMVTFLYSVVLVFSMAMFTMDKAIVKTEVMDTETGEILYSEEYKEEATEGISVLQQIGTIVPVMLIGNIPTFILLGIYFSCKEIAKKKCAIEKMSIQDLE